jgi:hypothetical protein
MTTFDTRKGRLSTGNPNASNNMALYSYTIILISCCGSKIFGPCAFMPPWKPKEYTGDDGESIEFVYMHHVELTRVLKDY